MTMLQEGGALLTGLGLGVGLMYFFDPERGRRRPALVRDRLTHSAHLGPDAAGATGRDVAHRAEGIVSRLRDSFDRALSVATPSSTATLMACGVRSGSQEQPRRGPAAPQDAD